MAKIITMPQLGESVVEGTVGKWLVQQGQRVELDQPVVEILTDKADSEVPSPSAGVVTKLLVVEGQVVGVGDALCEVDDNATASAGAAAAGPPPTAPAATAAAPALATPTATGAAAPRDASSPGTTPAASPSVRRLAREHGVDLHQLGGDGERVTRQDVLRAAAGEAPAPQPQMATAPGVAAPVAISPPAPPPAQAPVAPSPPQGLGAFRVPPYMPRPGDEIVPMSRRRRIIADHMVYSKLSSPHVVTMAECDIHATDKLRNKHKGQVKAEGINLTMLAFVAAATARALREFRPMNARMLDDSYVLLADINLGIAVETPEGLVVPVIRNADELTVRGLARAIDELAGRARDGQLTPDDLAAKTFTISNPGRRGNLVGGAIISQPNVGILRTGEIKKRVVVVEHEGEDLMAIHKVMHMALSYDHRIVDGVAANGFLYRVSELLEAGDFAI
ncbi:MAG: 2-oxo acid dehydrogenase subunit E2 [Myxococcales bacterium]|nr:2-oxo acid dehydrogenase subunit E2 [Myxococcales bacterium]